MNKLSILLLALFSSAAVMPTKAEQKKQRPVTLANAHAHNDYYHKRPLLDALDQGFCSVEVDIFLLDAQLLVGHSKSELNRARSLESLYLKPLKRRVIENKGSVFPDGPPFTLLVDIKSNAETTYAALDKVLAKYADILSVTKDGKHQAKAVTIVISGNRAEDDIANTATRHAGIDGRLTDIDREVPMHLMPLISDHWRRHFTWKGQGKMPEKERRKLRDIVRKIHQQGRRIRFWATPENPRVWSELLDAGVDLIGTDDLGALNKFLRNRND